MNYLFALNFKSFACAECGKSVVLKTGFGRTREYKVGHHLPIPDDFPIPTCSSCGETYMSEEISEILDPILQKTIQHICFDNLNVIDTNGEYVAYCKICKFTFVSHNEGKIWHKLIDIQPDHPNPKYKE